MVEAFLYEKKEDGSVQCNLCCHRCHVKADGYGRCKVRRNTNGCLESLVYSKLIAINPDPIEKKPLYHFFPGTLSYSIASVGCNFRCSFCQNADISQMPRKTGRIEGNVFSAADVVADAQRHNCQSIAYTYTEPTINFEFVYDTAVLAREKGIKNIFVSNGYMTPEAIDMIAPYLDAANIDLKAFSDDFYQDLCNARLEPVLETLKRLKARGVFLEVTTLLIPGHNDAAHELIQLTKFISEFLGPETPWHISRFHPTYELTAISPTPVGRLQETREIGMKAGLKYVYIGNVPGHNGGNTYCPACGNVLVERAGFLNIKNYHIKDGHCTYCGETIEGVGL